MVFMLVSPAIADAPVNVIVNGKILSTPGLVINDRTYVPLRAVSEGLGAQVDWDGSQAIVTSVKEPNISGKSASIDRVKQALDLLKEKDPADYEFVCRYTKEIKILPYKIYVGQTEGYAMTGTDPVIELSPRLFQDKDVKCIAGTLVHESVHLCDKSYNASIDIPTTENNAYLHQIAVLRILGASQSEIDGIEQTRIRVTK